MSSLLKICFLFAYSSSLTTSLALFHESDLSSFFPFVRTRFEIGSNYQALSTSVSLGQIAGIAVNKDDVLIVFHRADRTWNLQSFDKNNRFNISGGPIKDATLAVIDRNTGRVLKEGGKSRFYMPHGLSVDDKNNIWITDVGLHQVLKLDKDFKVLLTIGEKFSPGSDEKHFCMPTDVAVAKNGDIFVSDGYCNSRIMKFDYSGKFITSFERLVGDSELPADGSFLVPHSIAIDDDMNMICVADRENEEISCFGTENNESGTATTGVLLTKVENTGRVYAIRFKEHSLFGVTAPYSDRSSFHLFVMDLKAREANVILQDIQNAHCIDIANDGTIYIGQTYPKQILEMSLNSEGIHLSSGT